VLDALVRSMAQRLQAKLGQTFIVENVPGASGNIGMAACGRAPGGWPPSSRVRRRRTFYVLAVYFGSVGVKNRPHALG
jgi:tripartite-type tricarboxylate transporter receptor subunit TctC